MAGQTGVSGGGAAAGSHPASAARITIHPEASFSILGSSYFRVMRLFRLAEGKSRALEQKINYFS